MDKKRKERKGKEERLLPSILADFFCVLCTKHRQTFNGKQVQEA